MERMENKVWELIYDPARNSIDCSAHVYIWFEVHKCVYSPIRESILDSVKRSTKWKMGIFTCKK